MKGICIFLLIIILVVSTFFIVPNNKKVTAWSWDENPLYVYKNRYTAGIHIGHQNTVLRPAFVDSPFGGYLRTENLEGTVSYIYRVPKDYDWREISNDFEYSCNLIGTIISKDDCLYLPKGIYIVKTFSDRDYHEGYFILGPRLKP